MKTNADKRACVRHSYTVPIVFSYFNKKHCIEARTLNYCARGMCLKSYFSVHPGATIYIRLTKYYPNGSFQNGFEILSTIRLAEVKWCREILDLNESFYEIGVKYYELEY